MLKVIVLLAAAAPIGVAGPAVGVDLVAVTVGFATVDVGVGTGGMVEDKVVSRLHTPPEGSTVVLSSLGAYKAGRSGALFPDAGRAVACQSA